MSKEQEAFKAIADHFNSRGGGGLGRIHLLKQVKTISELVEKATPKKTIKRGRGCCPNCGENLLGGHDLGQEWIKHCFNCGQKLDWGGEDE